MHNRSSDTFPNLVVGGTKTPDWVNVRKTNNFQTQAPVRICDPLLIHHRVSHVFALQVTDVKSADFRCYDSATGATAQTITVAAGSQLGIACDQTIYHPGVVNVYMAKAPSGTDVANWDGSGTVWFKVYQISAVTNGGESITFPAEGVPGVTFTLPSALPSGQ